MGASHRPLALGLYDFAEERGQSSGDRARMRVGIALVWTSRRDIGMFQEVKNKKKDQITDGRAVEVTDYRGKIAVTEVGIVEMFGGWEAVSSGREGLKDQEIEERMPRSSRAALCNGFGDNDNGLCFALYNTNDGSSH